jgi:hypothetical protein
MQWSLVSNTAGFGNLLDGQHPIWIGDFTGANRAQVLFYYQGDGNWWLADISGGQMQWSLRFAAEMSLALSGLMSGASNISCSCSTSSIIRSTSIPSQSPT